MCGSDIFDRLMNSPRAFIYQGTKNMKQNVTKNDKTLEEQKNGHITALFPW
jgi:hypothetical protein